MQCNAATNPPDAVDQGRCVCTVEFAPAAPMEFIRLVVMLSTTGELEVFES